MRERTPASQSLSVPQNSLDHVSPSPQVLSVCNLASLLSGVAAPAVDLEALRVAAAPPHQGGQVELGAVGHRVDRVVGAEGRADRLLPASKQSNHCIRLHPKVTAKV